MKLKTNDHETSLTSSPRASTDAVPSEAKPTQKPLLTTNYMASSSITRLESPSRATPSIESPATPLASLFPTSPTQKSDPKVVSILELNSELLKVCIDFQSRGFAVSDMKFQQFSSRLQSNLTWLAAAADQSRNHLNMLLPIMDPPPSIDFAPTDRIRQLYAELPSIFAKEIARRSQIPSLPPSNVSSPNTPLKRERSDESPVDIALKRRNTGDSKSPSAMMPPPSLPSTSHNSSTHFSLPMSNGPNVGSGSAPPPPSSPQLSESQMSSINPGMMNTSEAQLAASNRERVRQAQIRAAQQQQASRQMSPPSMPAQQQMHGGPMSNMNVNAAAGPSNSSNMPSVNGVPDATLRQIYHVLRTPDHPFMRYMLRSQPNFQSLPTEVQVQRMMVAQVCIPSFVFGLRKMV
ncbi:hypothetical protein L208DRAFT_56497 [Tricholoma matsutake]|nr:hypothetical protein L208DRAFT_56497 [Tricholoma matsutake 945]